MHPDQVISIIRNNRAFKQDLDRIIDERVSTLVETAVLKGQLELIDMLRYRAINQSQNQEDPINPIIDILNNVSQALRRQLDHAATTEVDHIHNFVEYRAQGIGIPMRMCTICGETQ
jgi:hypothetical protein